MQQFIHGAGHAFREAVGFLMFARAGSPVSRILKLKATKITKTTTKTV